MANLPTGTEESAVTIRTLSQTLYALLATLTTGRSLRLVQRVPNRNGFEAWRQMAAENAPKTAGRRFAMLQAVLQPGMSDNPAKFEETWKSWEHQMDIYENLFSTKLDDAPFSRLVIATHGRMPIITRRFSASCTSQRRNFRSNRRSGLQTYRAFVVSLSSSRRYRRGCLRFTFSPSLVINGWFEARHSCVLRSFR